jgi:hypothetical protein
LWRESVTSHGMNESAEATDAPKPKRTSKEGSAQQSRVLSDCCHSIHFGFSSVID